MKIRFFENPRIHKRGGPWSREARERFSLRIAFRKWARIYWPEALK